MLQGIVTGKCMCRHNCSTLRFVTPSFGMSGRVAAFVGCRMRTHSFLESASPWTRADFDDEFKPLPVARSWDERRMVHAANIYGSSI